MDNSRELSVKQVWTSEDIRLLSLIVQREQVTAAGRFKIRFPLTHIARFACATIVAAIVYTSDHGLMWTAIAFFTALVLVGLAQWLFVYENGLLTVAHDIYAAEPGFYQDRTVSVDDTHVSEYRPDIETHVALSAVQKVTREEALILIWTNRCEVIIAVPERSFRTPEDAGLFARQLQDRVSAAKQAAGS